MEEAPEEQALLPIRSELVIDLLLNQLPVGTKEVLDLDRSTLTPANLDIGLGAPVMLADQLNPPFRTLPLHIGSRITLPPIY